jgi:hypothetical protein
MTDEEIQFLTSAGAQKWLDLAAAHKDPLVAARLLRKQISPVMSRLAIEQAELRHRGAEKFSMAPRMFFTRVGLEQATDEAVARYKASRFPADVALADLCCGIGGDLMALARRGPTVGVDRDSALARVAEANARVAGVTARVVAADVAGFSVAEFAGWHIDPDRRPDGKRTTHVAFHDPTPNVIAKLLGECPHAAIKLAPAAGLPDTRRDHALGVSWREAELEWISRKRECRQLVAWFGSLAQFPGMRRATVVLNDIGDHGPIAVVTFEGQGGLSIPVAPTIGCYVYEPDAAALAADLAGALAQRHGLQVVSAKAAYLTADSLLLTPFLGAFEVLEVLPYDAAKLNRWLRARSIGTVEVKKRGVEIDPARLQRELRGDGDDSATVLLCPIHDRVTAIVARRI